MPIIPVALPLWSAPASAVHSSQTVGRSALAACFVGDLDGQPVHLVDVRVVLADDLVPFVRYWPKAGMTLADISQCDWTTVQLDRLAGITFNSCGIRAATARCPTKASCTFGIQESDICGVLMLVSVLFRAPLGH